MKKGGCLYQFLSLCATSGMAVGAFSAIIFFINFPRSEPSLLISGFFFFATGFFGYRGLQSIKTLPSESFNDSKHSNNTKNQRYAESNTTGGNGSQKSNRPDLFNSVSDDRHHAKILGLSEMFTYEECRSAYRERIAKYHPDKVAHLGEKLKETAEQESKAINLAYKYFCDTRFSRARSHET